MQDGAGCPGLEEMQIEEGEEVPRFSVTGARQWKQENAEPAATVTGEIPPRRKEWSEIV